MTVIQLWQSYTGEVITLANRNVREGLAENNVKKKQPKKSADWLCWVINYFVYTPLALSSFFFLCQTKGQIQTNFSDSIRISYFHLSIILFRYFFFVRLNDQRHVLFVG